MEIAILAFSVFALVVACGTLMHAKRISAHLDKLEREIAEENKQ